MSKEMDFVTFAESLGYSNPMYLDQSLKTALGKALRFSVEYGDRCELEGRIDERRRVELPFKGDHSKCIDRQNCMGYMNADADLRGENELRIAELEAQRESL